MTQSNEPEPSPTLIDIPSYDPRTTDQCQFSFLRHHFQDDSQCSVVTLDIAVNPTAVGNPDQIDDLQRETLEYQDSQMSLPLLNEQSLYSKSTYAEMKSNFEMIKHYTSDHPSLCAYIDCLQGRLEYAIRVYIVQESYPNTLASLLKSDPNFKSGCRDLSRLQKWATQIASGLVHLQMYDIQHRNLIPENIFVDNQDNLKIFNHAIYTITSTCQPNTWPSFYICPPESLQFGIQGFSSYKADIWALGLLLFEIFAGRSFLDKESPKSYFESLSELLRTPSLLQQRIEECVPQDWAQLKSFLLTCLDVDPEKRPTPYSLLSHPFLHSYTLSSDIGSTDQSKNIHVLFHLWQLDSGSLDAEFTKATGITSLPPILTLPFVYASGHSEADAATPSIPLFFYPPFCIDFARILACLTLSEPIDTYFTEMVQQPMQVRLKSVPYQYHRIRYCTDLLLQYPLSKKALQETCVLDIPAFLRAELWASLLNIPTYTNSVYSKYSMLSLAKEYDPDDAWITLDRQLEADLPRCHVYEPKIASDIGKRNLKKVIQVWLEAHPDHVYWQGFDSVCAVFVSLSFTRLEMAYLSLATFVDKYLANLLMANNSDALHAHMRQFHYVLSYVDPALSMHLCHLNLDLQHFGISWILTLFAHVFEFSQVYLVWDQLLTQPFVSTFLFMSNLLRLHIVRSSLMAAETLEEGLHAVSEFPSFDVFELLQSVNQDLKWIPRSTLFSFQLKEKENLPQISLEDCKAHVMDLRIIDLRPKITALPNHFPGSSFIALADLNGIESIMKEQREDKKITVVRGDRPTAIAAMASLITWGVPGLCWLHDLDTPTCRCTPNEIPFLPFSIHKCKQSLY